MYYNAFSLSGTWEMGYSQVEYSDTACPSFSGVPVKDAVPGYFEDMADKFRMTPFFRELRVNPSFGIQKYPILHYCPDMALPNVYGCFFYRRHITCKDVTAPSAIHFVGVQNTVSVWINGEFVGKHEGYSTAFELDIPSGLIKDGDNEFVMAVSNLEMKGYGGETVSGLTNRAACEYTGGITGEVELRVYTSHLRDAAVLISEDLKTAEVRPDIDQPCEFSWAVSDGDRVILKGTAKSTFSFDASSLEHWSPESPKLYTLTLVVGASVLTRKFGVRRLTTDGVHLRLNGAPVYLRGICEHCYYPETVHPTHDIQFYRNVITKLKNLGFNFIRFHTHIPTEEYMQAADELGMLLHVESPNYTSLNEWYEIINVCRRHPSVVIYCCGNELLMDDEFIGHIEECGDAVHISTDALFSPMSALRGLEYFFHAEPEKKCELVSEPIEHNPRRFARVGKFADVYSSFALGQLSYTTHIGNPSLVDSWSTVYNKPRLSHEICIHGTYADLSLEERYKGTRIGETAMFSSVRDHLQDKGILQNAEKYYKNSCEWQRRLRKHCFETARLCKTVAGYDFLGPIDTHWHTFGYDCGMMNEFYELKHSETEKNVLSYNSATVVLNDLGTKAVFTSGESVNIGILVSHYGEEDLYGAALNIKLLADGKLIKEQKEKVDIMRGTVAKLCDFSTVLPELDAPNTMKLSVTLEGGKTYAENQWELYAFPRCVAHNAEGVTVADGMTRKELITALENGETVVLLGSEPFESLPTSFNIALAGRTSGNLATVIYDHPVFDDFPHDGFCSWQFFDMLEGGKAVSFECENVPFEPIIEVVSTHKCAIKQSALFEFNAINGRLLVCSLNLRDGDPAAVYLKNRIISYAEGDRFKPKHTLDADALCELLDAVPLKLPENTNVAFNPNDKANRDKKTL